jgi:hypothetical protein
VPQLGAAAAAVAEDVAAAARLRQLCVLAGASVLALARLAAAAVSCQRVCTAAWRQASPTTALGLQLVPLQRLLLLLLLLSCQRLDEPQVGVPDAAVAQLHAHAECIVRKQQQEQTKQREADDSRGLAAHACPHVQAVPGALLDCQVVEICCAAVGQHGPLHVIHVAAATEHAGVPVEKGNNEA